MATENLELMKMARESLKGKWGLAIGTFVVYGIIVSALQIIPIAGPIAGLIIGGPFTLGVAMFSIAISRNQDARLELIFEGFQNFGTALVAYLLMIIFVLLWCLLLIVPGIIAAISYSMTFYILADDKSLDGLDALNKSKQMMNGYKWKYFGMLMRFLGWALLCVLTAGIGFLWLIPYIHVSIAKFYDDIKANAVIAEGA